MQKQTGQIEVCCLAGIWKGTKKRILMKSLINVPLVILIKIWSNEIHWTLKIENLNFRFCHLARRIGCQNVCDHTRIENRSDNGRAMFNSSGKCNSLVRLCALSCRSAMAHQTLSDDQREALEMSHTSKWPTLAGHNLMPRSLTTALQFPGRL